MLFLHSNCVFNELSFDFAYSSIINHMTLYTSLKKYVILSIFELLSILVSRLYYTRQSTGYSCCYYSIAWVYPFIINLHHDLIKFVLNSPEMKSVQKLGGLNPRKAIKHEVSSQRHNRVSIEWSVIGPDYISWYINQLTVTRILF